MEWQATGTGDFSTVEDLQSRAIFCQLRGHFSANFASAMIALSFLWPCRYSRGGRSVSDLELAHKVHRVGRAVLVPAAASGSLFDLRIACDLCTHLAPGDMPAKSAVLRKTHVCHESSDDDIEIVLLMLCYHGRRVVVATACATSADNRH